MSAALPEASAVVQRQLEAYNAHDLPALLACYAEDAVQYEFPDRVLARGRAAIGARMAERFAQTRPQARLRQRSVIGDLVIDQEEITRQGAQGPERSSLVAIYRLRAGLIQEASFVLGGPL